MNDVCQIFPHTAGENTTLKYKQQVRILSKYLPLRKVITLIGPLGYDIPIWRSINDAILYAVIGQMLSVSASASAVLQWARRNCYKKGPVKGVSQRKRKALRAWYVYANDNYNRLNAWKNMPLNEYRSEICSIWGFGRWSADMIAIFHLGRMDVWPETDAGIQKSSRLVFGTDNYAKINRLISGCETVAALYLWELINRKILKDFINDYGQLNKRAKT